MRISRDLRVPVTEAAASRGPVIFRVPSSRVSDAGALSFEGPRRMTGIVNAAPDGFRAWINLCPHWNLPLDSNNPDLLTNERDRLICSVHGATFELDSGRCDSGPCAGSRLIALPLEIDNDDIVIFGPATLGTSSSGIE